MTETRLVPLVQHDDGHFSFPGNRPGDTTNFEIEFWHNALTVSEVKRIREHYCGGGTCENCTKMLKLVGVDPDASE